MAQKRSLAWAQLRVGLLVIVSFAVLMLAIFFISGQGGFFAKKYVVKAYFPSANGLKDGAEVQLEGVTVGNVGSVVISTDPDPLRSVEVELRLDGRYRDIIRSDSVLSILTAGLVGDPYVDIARGTKGEAVPDGGTLQGSQAGDIKRIISNTNDFVANLNDLSEQFKRLSDRVDKGEGTLGKLLTDSSIYDKVDASVGEVNALLKDAHSGSGTFGRLISDPEIYDGIVRLTTRVDNLVAALERGEGTAGRLLKDPALYNRMDQMLAQVSTVTERIERGEGTLGKLSKDDALYTDLRQTINSVTMLVKDIQSPEGTTGKLIKDPTMYNNLNQATLELQKLMSEFEKLVYDVRQDPKKYLTINVKLF